MVILYSITGVITALFLIIIITGAVRAHRHPERYGPGSVLGRPRQSRAKGLARAMLDTIPIVKFGDREPVKQTDVEMNNRASSERNAMDDTGAAGQAPLARSTTNSSREARTAANTTANPESRRGSTTVTAATAAGAAGIDPTAQGSTSEPPQDAENLGCSICTDDFELGQDIRVLPCNHKFHPACVDPWLLDVSGTCPLCRVDLRPAPTNSSGGEGAEGDAQQQQPRAGGESAAATTTAGGRRRTQFLRSLLNASPGDRIAGLRRVREEEEQSQPQSQPRVQDDDRSRRRRLQDAFGVRTRRRAETRQGQQREDGAASSTTA